MRLVCPNCGAQYEVSDDVIPENGRDVQCSNCGHTWYEHPGASEAAENAMDADPAPAQPEAVDPPQPAPEPEPEPEQDPNPQPEQEPEPQAPLAPRQREMDPEVADILREEAAFEEAARRNEANPIETQPDLDLSHDPQPEADANRQAHDTDEDRRSREARDRLARLRGEEGLTAVAGVAAGATATRDADTPRRELLPDIEEINSTLRQDNGSRTAAPDYDEPKKNSGFARGFMVMVIIALVALATYVFAPQISAAVPQAEPVMTSYVNWVDGMRLWLDAQIQTLAEPAADAPADS